MSILNYKSHEIHQPIPNLLCGCNCGVCKKDDNNNYEHQGNDDKHSNECTKCREKIAEKLTQEYNKKIEQQTQYEKEEDYNMYYNEGGCYKFISK